MFVARLWRNPCDYHAHRLWNPSASKPRLVEYTNLIGTPYRLSSEVDPLSGIDGGATATHVPLIVGDWQQAGIVDRIGMAIDFAGPMLDTANNRPKGAVASFVDWRVGSGVLIDDAFRTLLVTITA